MARMVSEISIGVLEALRESEMHADNLCDFIFSGGARWRTHGTKEKVRAFYRRVRERRWAFEKETDRMKMRQRLHNALHRLKKDGLIAADTTGRRSLFTATKRGIERLREWRLLRKNAAASIRHALPSTRYEKQKSASPIIVSFDIPEQEKAKRAWLRSALRNLDFKMLHRSTWIGHATIPKELIREIHRLEMDGYVKIFAITKLGTAGYISPRPARP